MGANQWREEDQWPPARSRQTRYFLHRARVLSTQAPGAEAEDTYKYDPANPVPTIGGPLCCDDARLPGGPHDQRHGEARKDVLVYSAQAFKKDVEVTGPVSVDLLTASSAMNPDFTAKLVDVWPNGFAQNLTEGIVRAHYRDSQEKPELLNPGQVYKFTIDLWSTSNVFLKGHQLRIEISSSNFPRFDRI